MSHPQGPPRTGRRVRLGPAVLGAVVGLVADSIAVVGLPDLQRAWSGPVAPLPSVSVPRTPSASGGKTTATASKSAPTSGAVKITDELKHGLVLISAKVDSQTTSSGTGMVLTADGQVLTNYHVVRSTTTISVTICDDHRTFEATVIGRDAKRDVALLQLRGASGLTMISPDRDPVRLGDPVVAAGNAAGQGFLTAFAGTIIGDNQNVRVRGASPNDPVENLSGLLETDAHAEPGDSGGPLFDAEHEVLGMTTAGSEAGKGSAFAVPIDDALAVVTKIRGAQEGDGVVVGPKASIGIMANQDGTRGIKISKVIAGSAAAKAGLKAGDYVTAVDGHEVATLAELLTTLDLFQPGESVGLEWRSGSTAKSATVTLDASKYN